MEVKNTKATSTVAGSLMVAARLSKVELDYHMIFKGCANCSAPAKITCPCSTKLFCSEACQRVVWTERGHHKVCLLLREMREAADARRAAQRSRADEARARIRAEHDAARARREAEPERKPPLSERFGSRCPICLEAWDVNVSAVIRGCCMMQVCRSCDIRHGTEQCCFCRKPRPNTIADALANLKRHAKANVPEAVFSLAYAQQYGHLGLVKDAKRSVTFYQRAVELGDVQAMFNLAFIYQRESFALDPDKAATLLRTAADRGHPGAQYECACMLVDAGNNDQAFSYFKLSAEQGFTISQRFVGNAYEYGLGFKADLKEAARWYGLAAAAGDADAAECLARVTSLSFLEVMRPKITEAYPTMSSGAVSETLATLWHEMDDAKKAHFNKLLRSEGAEFVDLFVARLVEISWRVSERYVS